MALFPAGAPSWASTAVNLQYQPIDGVSRIAYVDPLNGNDNTGTVHTWTESDGDYRIKPGSVEWFATGDAAIAAVGRDGPHAVLFVNVDSGVIHSSPVVNGGCQGLSAAHPYLLGAYWGSGSPGANLEANMAQFDPGLGPHEHEFMFNVQRGSGFSNLIIENLAFVQAHRIASDPSYDQTDATTSANFMRAMRIYGGNQSNILLRNIHVHGTAEGIAIEAVGHTSTGSQLHNVTLDNVCVRDVWQPSGTYEGAFIYGVRRLRVLNSCILGCGHNRLDLSLAEGDTAQGRNQGLYLSFCEDPWIHNSILAHNSHAGIQARCGGTVTACLFWANARNLGFGHGQNNYESRSWNYIAKAYDNVMFGSHDVGAGYPNPSATPLEIGEGLGWGRCNSADFRRNIIIGEDTYRSSDENFGINIGTTPGGGTTVNLESNIVYDWNASGVSTSGEIGIQSGASTGATLRMVGNRVFSKRGKAIYVQGTEPITKTRLSAASLLACRAELTGTAALYGPTGTAPSNVTAAFITASVRRADTWGGLTPPLEDVCGMADESTLIEEITTLGSTWDARRILNLIRELPQFGFYTIQSASVGIPNQTYEGGGA